MDFQDDFDHVCGIVFTDSPFVVARLFEPRREKTGLRGFRPGPTQTGLYSLRTWLEAGNYKLESRVIVLFL